MDFTEALEKSSLVPRREIISEPDPIEKPEFLRVLITIIPLKIPLLLLTQNVLPIIWFGAAKFKKSRRAVFLEPPSVGNTSGYPCVYFALKPAYAAHSQRNMAGKLIPAYERVNGAATQPCPSPDFRQTQELFFCHRVVIHDGSRFRM